MAELAVRARPQRKAKRTDVDYAVLSSGQQIPEYSSEEDESDADEPFRGARKPKRKRKARGGRRDECFICRKPSKSPFIQCDNCARLCVRSAERHMLSVATSGLTRLRVSAGSTRAAGGRSSRRPSWGTRAAMRSALAGFLLRRHTPPVCFSH